MLDQKNRVPMCVYFCGGIVYQCVCMFCGDLTKEPNDQFVKQSVDNTLAVQDVSHLYIEHIKPHCQSQSVLSRFWIYQHFQLF